jgi:hypothetical protein
VPIGPVVVWDEGEAVEELGWLSQPDALAEARRRGLELEES